VPIRAVVAVVAAASVGVVVLAVASHVASVVDVFAGRPFFVWCWDRPFLVGWRVVGFEMVTL
jgi:hypothetical protein